MADINLEEKYMLYDLDEIPYYDVMRGLADDLPTYLSSKRWLQNPDLRAKWMDAYLEIINHGITGASINNGQWEITHGGDKIDINSKSIIDLEIYADAAWYIKNKMSQITPRKKEEEVKKELEPFDFKTSFGKQLLNLYGGDSSIFSDSEQGWNSLDARGNNGLRDTKKRRRVMAELLELYKKDLEKGKDYNFEGTSFKDKNDALTKLLAAIDALGTDEESDDLPAFSALGLPYRTFFSNGGNDPYTKGDYTGTYSGYNEYLAEQNKAKQKAEQEKLKLQRANQYTNFRFLGQGLVGTPPSGNDVLQRLNTYVSLPKLDGNQQSELVGAFKFAEKNGILQNLSKEELLKFGSRWISTPSRLKKIDGLNGFYWDSVGKRVVLPYNQSNVPIAGFLDLVNLNSLENKQALAKSQLVKQMNLPIQGSLNLSDLSNFGFDEATGNELWAVINDIGAFVNPEAISGTALALNAARLRDKNRLGWSWERVFDWGTSALGGLPAIGDAASVIKAGSNLVKLANKSARVGSFIAMAFSAVNMPEAWDSIKKIYNKGITSMTPQDILNITYGLMGLFAGIKTINSVNARQKPQTATEHSIEIDGKKVKLPDQATADKVSTEYKSAKNNTEASLKVVKMQEVRDAAKKAGIEITDASKVTSGSGFLRGNLVSRKLRMGKSPVKSKLVNTGEMIGNSTSRYYMPSWRRNFLNLEQKEIKNPLRKTFDWFLGRTPEVKSAETPKTNSTETPKTTGKRTWSEIEKGEKQWTMDESMKEWKDILKGELKPLAIGENFKAGDFHFNVMGHSGSEKGVIEINFGSKKESIKFENLKDLRKKVLKFMKENAPKITIGGKSKYDAKKMGEILRLLKAKGVFKQGGRLDKQKIQQYKNFIKK